MLIMAEKYLILDFDGTITTIKKGKIMRIKNSIINYLTKDLGISYRRVKECYELIKSLNYVNDKYTNESELSLIWALIDILENENYKIDKSRIKNIITQSLYTGSREIYSRRDVEFLNKHANRIIIVSNSPKDLIENILKKNGVENMPTKIIDNAKKDFIDDSFDKVPKYLNKYFKILLRRPCYFQILEDLRNSYEIRLVVGDMFSMDLALPLYLGMQIVLRKRFYTPYWAKELTKKYNGKVISNIYQLETIPS